MKLVYNLEPIPYAKPTVFLAGPTPRDPDVRSWRENMVANFSDLLMLNSLDSVHLILPEERYGVVFHGDGDRQNEWEHLAIESCDVLFFWVPRSIEGGMPGFTTNVEFGLWLDKKEHVVFGHPGDAEKVSYLAWLYRKYKRRDPERFAYDAAKKVVEILAQ